MNLQSYVRHLGPDFAWIMSNEPEGFLAADDESDAEIATLDQLDAVSTFGTLPTSPENGVRPSHNNAIPVTYPFRTHVRSFIEPKPYALAHVASWTEWQIAEHQNAIIKRLEAKYKDAEYKGLVWAADALNAANSKLAENGIPALEMFIHRERVEFMTYNGAAVAYNGEEVGHRVYLRPEQIEKLNAAIGKFLMMTKAVNASPV